MIDQPVTPGSLEAAEAALREELARGDAVADTVAPILRHLIAAGDVSLFSEEILARVRAMLTDLATALLDALAGREHRRTHSTGEIEVVGRALLDNPPLLTHLHALALEWQLTETMQARLALDPVMSPLLQDLMPTDYGPARAFLTAQSRWCQDQRRMKLPLLELPADLLNVALYTLRMLAGAEPELAQRVDAVEREIRGAYQESATRIGIALRLVVSVGVGSALPLARSGVPLFLSAVAHGAAQGRDAMVLATHEMHVARLALALRAAGLEASAVLEQLSLLHGNAALPGGFAELTPEHAAAILASRTGQFV